MSKSGESEQLPSLWDHKPWWCQPWSIVLSGALAVVISWIWLKLLWLSAVVAIGVSAWWFLFLILVPRAWSQAARETSGDSNGR